MLGGRGRIVEGGKSLRHASAAVANERERRLDFRRKLSYGFTKGLGTQRNSFLSNGQPILRV